MIKDEIFIPSLKGKGLLSEKVKTYIALEKNNYKEAFNWFHQASEKDLSIETINEEQINTKVINEKFLKKVDEYCKREVFK